MIYIFLMTMVLILCFAAGSAFVYVMNLIRKKTGGGKLRLSAAVGLTVSSGLFLMIVVFFIYTGDYYHAEAETEEYLTSSDSVRVTKLRHGYYFDGKGTKNAVIFYPGGKVETESYAPMLYKLADSGEDAFLMDMPFRLPVFGIDRASEIIEDYDYENWYLCGHSLGGVAGAEYVRNGDGQIKGLIMLASYTNGTIPDDLAMLSVYGTEDGCMNRDVYELDREYWPAGSEEYVMEGGNHSQFGDYGFQSGDGEAKISRVEQQELTCKAIDDFMEKE